MRPSIIIILLLHSGLLLNGQIDPPIDSLLQILDKTESDADKITILNNITHRYQSKAKYALSLPYALQGYELSNKMNYNNDMAIFSEMVAKAYGYTGNYGKDIYYTFEAIKYFESKGDQDKVNKLYTNIEHTYLQQFNYTKALEIEWNALKRAEANLDTNEIILQHANIGQTNHLMCIKAIKEGDYISANKYYKNCIENYSTSKKLIEADSSGTNIVWINEALGLMLDKGNLFPDSTFAKLSSRIDVDYFKESLLSLNKALSISQNSRDTDGIITSYSYLGTLYKHGGLISEYLGNTPKAQNEYSLALQYYESALNLKRLKKYTHGIAFSLKDIGSLYILMKRFSDAEKSILQAIYIFKEIGFKEGIKECYMLIYGLYEKTFSYKKALEYYKYLTILKDSIFNETSLKQIEELNIKYETSKKESEIIVLNKDREIKIIQIKKQIFYRNTLISGIIGLGLLSLLVYINLSTKRKREKAELSSQLIGVKQEALNAQIGGHFVGNTMNSINNFIEKNEKDKASQYLIKFNRLIRNVLEDSFKKLVTLDRDLTILTDYIELEKLHFSGKGLNTEIIIDESIEPESTLIPPMIFQIFVENSINHGIPKSRGGKVRIEIMRSGANIICKVEDDGIGRLKASQIKEAKNTTRTSIGGTMAERLVKLLNQSDSGYAFEITDITNESNEPAGTRIEFSLPFIAA